MPLCVIKKMVVKVFFNSEEKLKKTIREKLTSVQLKRYDGRATNTNLEV